MRRGLQIFLTILGTIMLVAGTVTVILGAGTVLGAGAITPTVDSEMRFFAVWYAAAGVVVLNVIPRVESETRTIRAVGGLFFIAGCARLVSLAVVGKPHTLSLVLMVIELGLPFVIVPWQSAVSRQRLSVTPSENTASCSVTTPR